MTKESIIEEETFEMDLQEQVKFQCGEMIGKDHMKQERQWPPVSYEVVVQRPSDQGLIWGRGSEVGN